MLKQILILFLVVFAAGMFSCNTVFAATQQFGEFEKFQKWADDHDITLQGTNKKTNELYYNGWDKSRDSIDWKLIPNSINVYTALSKLPNDILDVAKGQTIYISNQDGRSYTVLGSWPEYQILENMNKGIILEQPISTHTILHEFGHIVDFNAIQCYYGCSTTNYNATKDQRMEIFSTPQLQYISSYASTNSNENFAENFAYYVNQPSIYKEKLADNLTLKKEYNFLNNIFSGKTFS